MVIRRYNSLDLDGVLDVWERASEIGHPFLSKEFISAEKRNIPARYLPNGDAWVASDSGSIVGFAILHGNEVGALFVSPEHHGCGVGYALMNKAREIHGNLAVEVFKNNPIGTKFYLRYGFNIVREYLHSETDEILLCLKYLDKN